MSSTKIYGFTTESYYSYDSDDLQLVGGEAKLKLNDYPGRTFSESYDSDTGFTYDNTKVEWPGTKLQQKDQTGTNEVFAATYESDINLLWNKEGVKTGIPFGTPVISGSKLVCQGANGVYYAGNTKVAESHKFTYTPNYTTGPSANINVWSCWNGLNSNDRVNISNSPSGNNLRLFLYDSVGTQLEFALVVTTWAPVAGTDYEFEIVIDSTAGTVRIFIDGVLRGTETRAPWTRGTDETRYYLGADDVIYRIADGSFANYVSFDNAQHTTDYTPSYTIEPYRYVESYVLSPVETADGSPDGSVVSVQTWAVTPDANVRFTFASASGTAYWYNETSSAWELSDQTYAQSSTPAIIVEHLVDFPFAPETTEFRYGIVFPDNNGDQDYMDNLSVEYTHQIYPTDSPILSIAGDQKIFADGITSLTEVVDETYGEIRYVLSLTGTKMWWNGSAWATSNGTYTESSSGTDVSTNIGTLITAGKFQVGIDIFFNSTDGMQTPSINTLTLVYDQALGLPTRLPTLVDVNGYIYNSCCPMQSLELFIRPYKNGFNNPNDNLGGGVFQLYAWKSLGTTDSDGYFSGGIYLQPDNEFWEIKIGKQRYKFELPDADAVEFNTIPLTLVED